MHIKSVTFGFTKNMGNFQSARADATIELEEGDNYERAFLLAEAIVYEELEMPLNSLHQDALREVEEKREEGGR